MGRALADARQEVPGFRDPFAIQLLPDEHRAAVDRLLARQRPRSAHGASLMGIGWASEWLMGPRTVEIDDALRTMPRGHQLVIVGAGLDARAYRMREVSESVVFEVDHPASQALKRERAGGLEPACKELRYVPVDFSREALSERLAKEGHSATVPTAWVFEGVITYLRPSEVEATLAAMAGRSAPGSLLVATYNQRDWVRRLFAAVSVRAGEPYRVSYLPSEMAVLLARHGFVVVSDRDGVRRAERLGLARWGDRLLRFHHVVVAKRS
jgi:methyltransferase (TIGR00027 family)